MHLIHQPLAPITAGLSSVVWDRKRLIRKRVEALQASITAHNANGELHKVRCEVWITTGKPESQIPELINTQKQLEQRQGDLKAEFEYLRAMGVRISWSD